MKNFATCLLLALPHLLLAITPKCSDTLLLKTGEHWIVEIKSIKDGRINYRDCRQTDDLTLTLPIEMVAEIRSFEPEFRMGNFSEAEKIQIAEDLKLKKESKKIKGLGVAAGLTFFYGIGLILGIVVLIRASQFLKKTAAMPRTPFVKKIRRRVKFGRLFAFLFPLVALILVILLFLATFSIDFDFF